MDARLDPAKYAGLSEGDAHVIRNAGGRASDDAIRSLVISYKLLGTPSGSSIHHTELRDGVLHRRASCAACSPAASRRPNSARTDSSDVGTGPGSTRPTDIDWLTISDQQQSVVEDVRRIRDHPLVPRGSRSTATSTTSARAGSRRWPRRPKPVAPRKPRSGDRARAVEGLLDGSATLDRDGSGGDEVRRRRPDEKLDLARLDDVRSGPRRRSRAARPGCRTGRTWMLRHPLRRERSSSARARVASRSRADRARRPGSPPRRRQARCSRSTPTP